MQPAKKIKRDKTPEQAYAALIRLCARSEKSSGDALRLMQRWGVEPSARQGVLQKLLADRFIDDNRYAEAFVRDKIRLSGWGARKIRTSLRLKGIAAAIKKEYTPVLKHMTRTQGRVLLKLIDRKRNTRLTKSSGSSGAASSRDSGKAYRVSSDRISSRNTTEKGTTRYSNRSFSITKRGCCKPHPPAVHRQSPLFSVRLQPPQPPTARSNAIHPPIRQTKIPIRARSPDHSVKIQIYLYLYFCSAFS